MTFGTKPIFEQTVDNNTAILTKYLFAMLQHQKYQFYLNPQPVCIALHLNAFLLNCSAFPLGKTCGREVWAVQFRGNVVQYEKVMKNNSAEAR